MKPKRCSKAWEQLPIQVLRQLLYYLLLMDGQLLAGADTVCTKVGGSHTLLS